MKIGIILFLIGSILTLYFSKIKFKKTFFAKAGIVVGVLITLYSIILMVQPSEYVVYTKTTISQESNTTQK